LNARKELWLEHLRPPVRDRKRRAWPFVVGIPDGGKV